LEVPVLGDRSGWCAAGNHDVGRPQRPHGG
jgi:hypothetical protein